MRGARFISGDDGLGDDGTCLAAASCHGGCCKEKSSCSSILFRITFDKNNRPSVVTFWHTISSLILNGALGVALYARIARINKFIDAGWMGKPSPNRLASSQIPSLIISARSSVRSSFKSPASLLKRLNASTRCGYSASYSPLKMALRWFIICRTIILRDRPASLLLMLSIKNNTSKWLYT